MGLTLEPALTAFAADGGLNRILNVGNIDTPARGRSSIHREGQGWVGR